MRLRLLAWLPLNCFRQVDVADGQFTCPDKASHSGFADGKGRLVGTDDVVDGLALFNKRGYDIIYPDEFLCGEIEAAPVTDQGLTVCLLCSPGIIDVAFIMAESSRRAGVAKVKRVFQHSIALGLNVVRAVLFCLGTGLAFFLAAGGATDMEAGAGVMVETVTLLWPDNGGMPADLP